MGLMNQVVVLLLWFCQILSKLTNYDGTSLIFQIIHISQRANYLGGRDGVDTNKEYPNHAESTRNFGALWGSPNHVQHLAKKEHDFHGVFSGATCPLHTPCFPHSCSRDIISCNHFLLLAVVSFAPLSSSRFVCRLLATWLRCARSHRDPRL